MTQWIAEEQVVFVHPDGKRVVGRIAVAAPIVREQDCACEVVLEGLERSCTIFGDTTLQALLLGVRFLGMRLHDQRSRGVRVELVGSEDPEDANDSDAVAGADVIAVLFGPMLCPSNGDDLAGA